MPIIKVSVGCNSSLIVAKNLDELKEKGCFSK